MEARQFFFGVWKITLAQQAHYTTDLPGLAADPNLPVVGKATYWSTAFPDLRDGVVALFIDM